MKCPFCGTCESRVKKTIIQVEEKGFAFGDLKQRRRECLTCGKCFYTYEVHEPIFRQLHPQTGVPTRRPLKTVPVVEKAQPPKAIPSSQLDLRKSLDD